MTCRALQHSLEFLKVGERIRTSYLMYIYPFIADLTKDHTAKLSYTSPGAVAEVPNFFCGATFDILIDDDDELVTRSPY